MIFLDDPTLESPKKKMLNPTNFQHHAIRAYKPPRLVTGKDWYVLLYAYDPVLGTMRRKRYRLNDIDSIFERRRFAEGLMKRLNERLINGWNPWIESENSNAYHEFSDVCDTFRRHISRQLETDVIRLNTYRCYASFLRLLEAFSKDKIKYIYQFDQSFANRYLDYVFIDRQNSARTRNNQLIFLGIFSTWLVEKQYIKNKPTDGISTLKRTKTKKNRTVIPEEILQRIGDYFRKNDVRMLLACYVLHACFIRPTEMSHLKIENVIFQKSTFFIPSEISKNRKDDVVTIPDYLKKLLLELKIDQCKSNDYLFSDNLEPGKKYRHPKQFNDRWDKMKKALKLPKEYKFYSLKDTGITELLRSGVDTISVRDQARHYNISMTDIYTPHDIQEANEKIKSNSKKF